MILVLYNPMAARGRGRELAEKSPFVMQNAAQCRLMDITKGNAFGELQTLSADDRAIVAGGDGTLNCFINELYGAQVSCPLYLMPVGSGNDFVNDTRALDENGLVPLNAYIKNLPRIVCGEIERRFINGAGLGLDGYCCESVNEKKERGKRASYTLAALKGLLYAFKPANAVVTVDGVARRFTDVWLVPVMKGRYFGGGFQIAPMQDRNDPQGRLSVMVAHGLGRLSAASMLLKAKRGEHTGLTQYVHFFSGTRIRVEFDAPCALQIDGETVKNVRCFEALA